MNALSIRSVWRGFLYLTLVVTFLLTVFSGYLIWNNNRPVADVTRADLLTGLKQSKAWLLANEAIVLNDSNSMLWWMIRQSAGLTRDTELQTLFDKYKSRWVDPFPDSSWNSLFDPAFSGRINPYWLAELPDYNIHFLYGLTCDAAMGKSEIVRIQNRPDFCWKHHPISPACHTHQLMGVRFMQERRCGDAEDVRRLVAYLQDRIVSQLTYDPRVVDVYLQRVLMLLESGAAARVKPVWVRNVLDEQLPDGGWAGFQPLIPVVGDQYLGFSARFAGIGAPTSNFHATAQGIFLLSILLNEKTGI